MEYACRWYRELFKELDIDKDIITKISNIGLKRCAEDMLKIMKPISIYLNMLQNDSKKSADVVRIWKDLIDNVTNIIDYDQIITPYHMLMMKYLK